MLLSTNTTYYHELQKNALRMARAFDRKKLAAQMLLLVEQVAKAK